MNKNRLAAFVAGSALAAGASRRFEEPGKLEEAARLAAGWFKTHLRPRAPESTRAHEISVEGASVCPSVLVGG